MNSKKLQIALINMPFGNLQTPSIGLGLLKAGLTQLDVTTRVYNFQFRFAEIIEQENYTTVYARTQTEELAGEFIFSPSLFGPTSGNDIDRYVNQVLRRKWFGETRYGEDDITKFRKIIRVAREKVDTYLDECLQQVLSPEPDIVGFTSLFHQHVASLSLAKRIKERLPGTCIIFGGANCEGTMGEETLQRFEFVDAVVSGEADIVFPEIVKALMCSRPIPGLNGVITRNRHQLRVLQQQPSHTPMVEDLDSLPLPDYDDYFVQLKTSLVTLPKEPTLLFETSRGCWWGEKHHCTFCGLNGQTIRFRSKSATRALNEFVYLTERYPGCSVNVVDNILDMDYFNDFLPMLAERKHGLKMFYEVKANMKKDQLRQLLEAGISEIQPGIESFSDNVLRIMRKGVSALQNVQLLKMCRELGVKVYYNLIWGFPGESPEDYEGMARLIPLVSHLEPPIGEGPIRIDRFSPNFEQSHELGLGELAPHPAYSYVYPFELKSLWRLAYFFVIADGGNANVAEYTGPLASEIQKWRTNHVKSDLFWMQTNKYLLIWDFRPIARESLTVLTGLAKDCYLECDQIRTPRQIARATSPHGNDERDEQTVRNLLDSFTERGLMIRQRDSYLALAYAK